MLIDCDEYHGYLCNRCHMPTATGSGHRYMAQCVIACHRQIEILMADLAKARDLLNRRSGADKDAQDCP